MKTPARIVISILLFLLFDGTTIPCVPKNALFGYSPDLKKLAASAEFKCAEEEKRLRGMAETVKASGATAVFCQKGIDDMAQHFLVKKGILAVKQAKESDMTSLQKPPAAK
jgi:hypothetical protein